MDGSSHSVIERGDQPVAAEGRAEPRHARVGIGAHRRVGHEHVQVGGRASHHFAEGLVRRLDAGGAPARRPQRRARMPQAAQERRAAPARAIAGRDAHAQEQVPLLAGREDDVEARLPGVERVRRRIEFHERAEPHRVQADVAEGDAVGCLDRRRRGAATRARLAAHLEQVDEVRGEVHRQPQTLRPVAVVAHHDALVARALVDELHAMQVDALAPQRRLAGALEVGIGHLRGEDRVVGPGGRTEQQRAQAVDQQRARREDARVAVIQAFGTAGLAAEVAARVEHGEGVAVLQRGRPALLQRRAGGDVVIVHDGRRRRVGIDRGRHVGGPARGRVRRMRPRMVTAFAARCKRCAWCASCWKVSACRLNERRDHIGPGMRWRGGRLQRPFHIAETGVRIEDRTSRAADRSRTAEAVRRHRARGRLSHRCTGRRRPRRHPVRLRRQPDARHARARCARARCGSIPPWSTRSRRCSG